VSTVVKQLSEVNNEIVLVCAGWKGRLAFEDMLLAGNIIHDLCDGSLGDDSKDGAKVAFSLYDRYGKDIAAVIHKSNHAMRLKEIVGADDVDYCCQIDTTDILPRLHEGMITLQDG
jgi:2-phosphosulfolactate phosphatase